MRSSSARVPNAVQRSAWEAAIVSSRRSRAMDVPHVWRISSNRRRRPNHMSGVTVTDGTPARARARRASGARDSANPGPGSERSELTSRLPAAARQRGGASPELESGHDSSRTPPRAARPARHPGDAGMSRRDVRQTDRRGGLRARLHERVRRLGGPTRHAGHGADLLRRDGRPGAEHLRRRVDSADRRRRHRFRQRAEHQAHGARLRARRLRGDHARGSGRAEALRPHGREVGRRTRRGA